MPTAMKGQGAHPLGTVWQETDVEEAGALGCLPTQIAALRVKVALGIFISLSLAGHLWEGTGISEHNPEASVLYTEAWTWWGTRERMRECCGNECNNYVEATFIPIGVSPCSWPSLQLSDTGPASLNTSAPH